MRLLKYNHCTLPSFVKKSKFSYSFTKVVPVIVFLNLSLQIGNPSPADSSLSAFSASFGPAPTSDHFKEDPFADKVGFPAENIDPFGNEDPFKDAVTQEEDPFKGGKEMLSLQFKI